MTTTTLYSTLFTIRSANQTLPLVRTILSDLVSVSEEVRLTRERLDRMGDFRIADGIPDDYSDEVDSIEKNLALRTEIIAEYLRELTALNLVPGKGSIDCVDFPALRNDEPICLCWRLGEPDVRFWHRFDESCLERRCIDLELIRQLGDHASV